MLEKKTSAVLQYHYIISNPCRGRFMGLLAFIFFSFFFLFFSYFFRRDFVHARSLEPSLVETPD